MSDQGGKTGNSQAVLVILHNLGWPLLWGMAGWVAFYALLNQGVITNPTIIRYTASHPVEHIEMAMFFVALAALVMKASSVLAQYTTLGQIQLMPPPPGGQPVEEAGGLLDSLQQLSGRKSNCYLADRLRGALQYVCRKGSADDLDDELKYLADLDAARQHDSYALVRLIIWAIPILGFLGTVIGITVAISNLSPEALEESIDGVAAGLGVAFDTTTLALALSIVLMFTQFLIDRVETELLGDVESRANAELVGRFQEHGSRQDPQVAVVRRMAEAVVQTTETLVRRQAEIWQTTIDAAHKKWSQLADSASRQTEAALGKALEQSVKTHTAQLIKAEEAAAARNGQHLQQLHQGITQHTGLVQAQQAELVKQGEIMLKAIEASGRVATLQKTLNDNLHALAGAKNFEDTVMSLSAAIHLLNTRLGQSSPDADPVELTTSQSQQSQGRAA